MRFLLLLFFATLAACDAAGPGFRGADKVVREVEGSRFSLRVRGNLAEAIRTSPEMLPRFPDVARKAAFAVQAETGCAVAWVEGDPSMMLLGLSCNGQKAPKRPKRSKMMFCDLYGMSTRHGVSEGILDCSVF